MPRQQTLEALVDWSYDLLTEEEKTLFAKIVDFHGRLDAGRSRNHLQR